MRTPTEVVRAWVDAFNRTDADALAGLYAETATNHQVMFEPVVGREVIHDMFRREFAAAAMVCIPENLFEDGEWAILEWRDPKGLRGCGFFHVTNGLIRFQRGYWDRLSFLRQQARPTPSEVRGGTAEGIDYDSVAELYDAYVTTDVDVPYFTAEVQRAAGPVLELTSGTGRLSVPLAEAGADLTCVDCSRGMLHVLAGKLAARGLKAELLCSDVCDLTLPDRFALAILPFQSFMEIVGEGRQRAALAAVFASLRPGGRFICTLHNPTVRRTQVDGVLRVVGWFPFDGGQLIVSGFERGGRPVVSRLQFFELFGPDGRSHWKRALAMEFEFVERDRFESLVVSAGFQVTGLHGDYERGAYDPLTSPVMIWVLDKPAGPTASADTGSRSG